MTDLETILSWFQTGDIPTEEEFRQTLSSFRHKNTKIPISEVDKLESLLNSKLNVSDIPDNMALVDKGQPKGVFNKEQITAMTMMLSDYVKDGKIRADKIEKLGLTDANDMIKAMSLATDAQKDEWRIAQRKANETYNLNQPRIDFINPPIIDKTKTFVQYVSLIGLNMFLPPASLIYVYRKADDTLYKTITNFQVYQSQAGIVTFAEDFSTWYEGEYYFVIYNAASNLTSIPDTNKILILSENVDNLPIPNLTYTCSNPDVIITGNSTAAYEQPFVLKSVEPIITEQELTEGVGVEISFNYAGWSWGRYPSRFSIGLCQYDKTINDTVIDLGVTALPVNRLSSVPNFIENGTSLMGDTPKTDKNFKLYIGVKNGICTIFCSELSFIVTLNYGYISDLFLKVSLIDGSNANDGGRLALMGITKKMKL
ncbi:hypothetical protein [Chryseobacterium sp. RLHN22]|uniref:hypothetical protein n=1 Tax=Chryseobacterium sp. RLHN22 TaxID=3437885 RepID=UPI003D9ADCA7